MLVTANTTLARNMSRNIMLGQCVRATQISNELIVSFSQVSMYSGSIPVKKIFLLNCSNLVQYEDITLIANLGDPLCNFYPYIL